MDRRLIRAWFTPFFLLCALSAQAQDSKPSTKAKQDVQLTTWIHIEGESGEPVWKTKALEDSIRYNVSNFARVSVNETSAQNMGCPEFILSCYLSKARDSRIQNVIVGYLQGQNLNLRSFETWTNTEVEKQQVLLNSKMTLEELRHKSFRLLKPFLQIGGLLDQHEKKAEDDAKVIDVRESGHAAVFFVSALLALGLMGLPVLRGLKSGAPLAFFTSLLWLVPVLDGPQSQSAYKISFLIAGGLWGFALISVKRVLVPRIKDLREIVFSSLSPVLKTWLRVIVGRLPFFILCLLPFFGLGIMIAKSASYTVDQNRIFLAPLILLSACSLMTLVTQSLTTRTSVNTRLAKYFQNFLIQKDIQVAAPEFQNSSKRTELSLSTVMSLFIFGFISILIFQSIHYHPTYIQRMQDQQKRLEDQRIKQERKNAGR